MAQHKASDPTPMICFLPNPKRNWPGEIVRRLPSTDSRCIGQVSCETFAVPQVFPAPAGLLDGADRLTADRLVVLQAGAAAKQIQKSWLRSQVPCKENMVRVNCPRFGGIQTVEVLWVRGRREAGNYGGKGSLYKFMPGGSQEELEEVKALVDAPQS